MNDEAIQKAAHILVRQWRDQARQIEARCDEYETAQEIELDRERANVLRQCADELVAVSKVYSNGGR